MSVPFIPFSRVDVGQKEVKGASSDGETEKEEELARTVLNVSRLYCNGTSATERAIQQQHPMLLPCARLRLEGKSKMKDR